MSAFRALMALILSILLALCGQEAQADRPRVADGSRPRFAYKGFERALESVSWADLGRELAELQPLLDPDAKPDRRVAPLRRCVVGRMQRLGRAGIQGRGPHGVFTHPAVLVNAIHFTLDEADKPLTGRQADVLYRIGSRYVACERERRRQAEPVALARLVEEAELKERMLTWVRASLTPGQQSFLQPPSTRGLVGWSFFDSCSVLGPHAHAVNYSDSAQLVEELMRERMESLGLNGPEAAIVRTHVSRFVAGLADVPANRGVLPRAHTLKMARETIELRRALLKEPSLRASVRAQLARECGFRVPLRVTAPLAGTGR
ncbi:MAG: hypothetical protein ACYTHK_02500 [Planctomycetota bacterium]|jgi:hypothetical protein